MKIVDEHGKDIERLNCGKCGTLLIMDGEPVATSMSRVDGQWVCSDATRCEWYAFHQREQAKIFQDKQRVLDAAARGEGCICDDCGDLYRVDLNVPDPVWRALGMTLAAGKAEQKLCGRCIMILVERYAAEHEGQGYLNVTDAGMPNVRCELVWGTHECDLPLGHESGLDQPVHQCGLPASSAGEEDERCSQYTVDAGQPQARYMSRHTGWGAWMDTKEATR